MLAKTSMDEARSPLGQAVSPTATKSSLYSTQETLHERRMQHCKISSSTQAHHTIPKHGMCTTSGKSREQRDRTGHYEWEVEEDGDLDEEEREGGGVGGFGGLAWFE
jgi:hypothetical protein